MEGHLYLQTSAFNIANMATFPKLICRFSAFPYRNINSLVETDKLILKFIWKFKEPKLAKQPCKRIKWKDSLI